MLHFGDWQPFPLTLTHRSTNDFVQYFIQTCKQIKIHFNYQVKTLPNHNLVFPSVFFQVVFNFWIFSPFFRGFRISETSVTYEKNRNLFSSPHFCDSFRCHLPSLAKIHIVHLFSSNQGRTYTCNESFINDTLFQQIYMHKILHRIPLAYI